MTKPTNRPPVTAKPATRPPYNETKPFESQSQDAALLAQSKSQAEWETRQPAQITKSDVDAAKQNPTNVKPPGDMGESQGAAS